MHCKNNELEELSGHKKYKIILYLILLVEGSNDKITPVR